MRKLDHKRVHRRSEKTQNSIQCLKIMGLVQICWFHARIEWKKLTAFRTRDNVRRLQAGESPEKFQRDL